MFNRILYFLFTCMLCLLFLGGATASAQYFQLNNNLRRSYFPFQLVRNMVVVQLKINQKGPFNFILDTGAGMIVITDPSLIDTLHITDRRTIKLSGLGNNDEYEAFIAPNIQLNMPGLSSVHVSAAFFKIDHFQLSSYAGIPIHGLLGYEFFSKLVVKLNFNDSTLTAYQPKHFRANKRYEKIPMVLEGQKPYINTCITFFDKSMRDCKLVVDIGAGHALSLEYAANKQWPTEKAISANLGMSLTGPIHGEIGRINNITLGKYSILNILSSFPDRQPKVSLNTTRDGNLGLDLLKRFTVIFDYPGGNLYLKSRGHLKDPIEHDMSGLEYFAGGSNLKQVFISRVEPGSPGDAIGLEEDDELLRVDLTPVSQLSLGELDHIFKSRDGRSLLLEVKRDNRKEKLILTLKRRI